MNITAAELELEGRRFIVALGRMELVKNSSEADMAIERIGPRFDGLPVVMMAQKDDGSPAYYGDSDVVELLRGQDIEQFPWQEYSVS